MSLSLFFPDPSEKVWIRYRTYQDPVYTIRIRKNRPDPAEKFRARQERARSGTVEKLRNPADIVRTQLQRSRSHRKGPDQEGKDRIPRRMYVASGKRWDPAENIRVRGRKNPGPAEEMFRIQQKRSRSGGKGPDPAEMSRTGYGKKMSGSGGNVSNPARDPPYILIYSAASRDLDLSVEQWVLNVMIAK